MQETEKEGVIVFHRFLYEVIVSSKYRNILYLASIHSSLFARDLRNSSNTFYFYVNHSKYNNIYLLYFNGNSHYLTFISFIKCSITIMCRDSGVSLIYI